MDVKKVAKIAFAAVCLGTSGVLLARYWREPPPRGDKAFTHWMCVNEKCANEFTLPWDTYQKEKHKPKGLVCPKCGTPEPERGLQCPNCSRIMRMGAHATTPKQCPYCKQPMPPPKLPDE